MRSMGLHRPGRREVGAKRFAALVVAGFLLLQGLWILTVPPFRGIDEFDHAFRAAGVATGQWRLTEPATEGRGMEVVVPADLVAAASAQCDWLPYPGPDNCFPIQELSGDRVRIATSAGQYNPLWYAAVGQAGRPFEGAMSLYAMRIATALASALGVGLAAWSLAVMAPGRWGRLSFLAALTPVLVYSTVVPGPNGLEMTAGLLLWLSLLALFSPDIPRRHDTALLVLATAAGGVLAILRALGPMWVGLIVLSVVGIVGASGVWTGVRRRWPAWLGGSAAVMAAIAAGLLWSVNQGMTGQSFDVETEGPAPTFEIGSKPIAWTLQMIAAFPLRRDTANPAVYMCAAIVLGFLLAAGVMRSQGRIRVALVTMLVTVILVPVVLTVLTVENQGVIWQGRYQLAWAVGIPVVAGLQLDRSRFLWREGHRPVWFAIVLLGIAHSLSVWGVAHGEAGRAVSTGDPSWVTLPAAVLGVSCLVVYLVWAHVVTRGPDVARTMDASLVTRRAAEHSRDP